MAEKKVKKLATKKKAQDEFDEEVTELTNGSKKEEKIDYHCAIELDENGVSNPLPMLFGYEDGDGNFHNTFTIRELTGKDEEFLSKSDIRNNSGKAITALLERAVVSIGTIEKDEVKPSVWHDIIRGLYTGDQDFMVLKVRQLSVGEEFELAHKCPDCGASLKTTVSVDELPIKYFTGDTSRKIELPRGYRNKKTGELVKTGTIRLANGIDREMVLPVAKKNVSTGSTVLLTRLVTLDGVKAMTNDIMSDLTLKDRDYLAEQLNEMQFGVETQIDITCDSCGSEFKGNFNPSNFI